MRLCSNVLLDCKRGQPPQRARDLIFMVGSFIHSFLRRNFSLRCSIKAQVAIWRRRAGREPKYVQECRRRAKRQTGMKGLKKQDMQQGNRQKVNSRVVNLCLTCHREAWCILLHLLDPSNFNMDLKKLLNRRGEIMSKCRHNK